MCDDWVIVMQKDVKQPVSKSIHQPLSTAPISKGLPSQQRVLPPKLSGVGAACPPPVKIPTKMVDDKDEPVTPPTPPSPSPSDGKIVPAHSADAINWVKSQLTCDLSKLNPTDREKCAAVESAIKFLLGARNGIAGDLKHFYQNTEESNTIQPAASAAWLIGLVDNIVSGNNITERIGRVIKLHHLTIRLWASWSCPATAVGIFAQGPMPLRFVVFEDRQPLAGAPINYQSAAVSATTINDTNAIWLNTISSSVYYPSVMPWNPVTHGFRYKVLHHQIIKPPTTGCLATPGASTYSGITTKAYHEIHVPLMGHRVTYDDDSASPATVVSGRICVGWDSDGNGFPSAPWTNSMIIAMDVSFVDG